MQLIRRNDELALLYEKIKIQRDAISHGEISYVDRLEDLRVLRLREVRAATKGTYTAGVSDGALFIRSLLERLPARAPYPTFADFCS